VSFALLELHERIVISLPPVGNSLPPLPIRNSLQTSDVVALPLKPSQLVVNLLTIDPSGQINTALDVSFWDADMAFSLVEQSERPEATLPLLRVEIPRPAGKRDEPVALILGQVSRHDSFVDLTLPAYPAAKRLAFFDVVSWHPRSTFALNEDL
jgi:hypothetical protein